MSRSDDLAAIESGLLSVRGLNNVVISDSKVLTEYETGVLMASAQGGNITLTLPAANRPMDVRVQRVDNTSNRLTVQASGAGTIKFHTHLRAQGYKFLVLLGAGDFWHLRSDGAGNWIPLDRFDTTALGRPVFETTVASNPGGWGAVNGALMLRADWPWLWDHAQASGMLATESLRPGREGGWTSGDGTSTFRIPDIRGEFLRGLDETRGIDPQRAAGSYQKGSLQTFDPSSGSPSVSGLWHTSDVTDAQAFSNHGLDPVTAEYSSTYSIYAAGSGASGLAGLGVVRPRNIAYPGRIKLI